MKFACESCRAQYMISDEKVGPRGVKFRCKKCNHVNVVRRAVAEAPAAAPPKAPEAPPAAGSLEDEIGAAFDNVVSDGGDGEDALGSSSPDSDGASHVLRHADAQDIFDQPRDGPVPLPPEQVEWFVAVGDQQQGPLPFEEVKARWEKAEIGPDTLCWREGLSGWLPLSQITELAGSLAPQTRPTEAAATDAAPWSAQEKTSAGDEPGWRPSAASALTALVAEEQEAARSESPKPKAGGPAVALPPVESTAVRTLLEDLPEPPPVEPSRVIPMSALPAAIAAGGAAEPKAAPAPVVGKKGKGGLVAGVAAAVLVLGGVGAYASGLFGGGAEPPVAAPAAPVAVAQAPAPVEEKKEPEPVEAPVVAEVPAAPEGEGAAGGGGSDTTGVAEGTAAVAEAEEPSAKKEEVAAAVAEEPSKPEPAPKAAPAKKSTSTRTATTNQRVAAAPARAAAPAPAPAPAPARAAKPRRSSGDLLAAGNSSSIDDLFEKEFSSPPPPAKTSQAVGGTYIPPAPGRGGSKPKSLAQGDILAVVASHKGPLKTCATNYKSSSGQSSGTVVMRWSILPSGKTTAVKPVKGAEHKELASCIGGLVKGWTFPAYDGPRMAPIDFPFQF